MVQTCLKYSHTHNMSVCFSADPQKYLKTQCSTTNAWQGPAYSLLGTAVSSPNKQ